MMQKIIFFLFLVIISSVIVTQFFEDINFKILLDNSGPYIGVNHPNEYGLDGEGIRIAVIDTGIDHTHPDLLGFGGDGKIIGGFDYVDNDDVPNDTNGHGTEVAGIIAADGALKGIAPKAKIISYRVSDDGESVSSDLIIKAIEQAIIDQVDIINISLGVNATNSKIDNIVNKAVDQGILVVTAAGNNGPQLSTIGSPGINPNVITVGASYNNITSSLVATLEVNENRFQILPMVGTKSIGKPINSEILFGEYGRERDFSAIDVSGAIVLVERGSDVTDEIVYFSDKEKNAADNGAEAIIVYNNKPGIFFGELIHDFASPDYEPRIPTLSISREEGLLLKEFVENGTSGVLNVFYHPDFVAHFSSRGPVSAFYIKPDLVAPGVFVNSTLIDGKYNVTSGTSFATPHVTGAAALLLQKNPNLAPSELKSIFVTTTDAVSDAYGNEYYFSDAGSGRLNVTRALDADFIITPPQLIFKLSPEKTMQKELLHFNSINDVSLNAKVRLDIDQKINFAYEFQGNFLEVTISSSEDNGYFEGKIIIENNGVTYNIPVTVYINQASIDVIDNDGELTFKISYLENWDYARISLINKETGKMDVFSATPNTETKKNVYDSGIYWIETKINTDEKTLSVYEIVDVKSTQKRGFDFIEFTSIPEKPIIIILVVAMITVLVGLKIRN